MDSAGKHERIQQSLLAPAESLVLQWLVRRIPSWTSPDHLTLLGLLAMILAGVLYFLSQWNSLWLHAVNVMIALNWFGDSLDGTLARFRRQLRPRYGYYVDHIIDCVGIIFLLAGLSSGGYMTATVALLFLVVYFLLSIDCFLAAHTLGKFQISFSKLSPTELRILLVIGNLVLLQKPNVHLFGFTFHLFDVGAAVGILAMSLIFLLSVVRNTRVLYRSERI